MDPASTEIPLTGGTLNTVVRVGDTVRRRSGPWTRAVHDLLRHVRAEGFELAPEPLGFDQSGREVLRFIPGDTAGWQLPWPAWVRSDEMLVEVGAALAAYHRAVSAFRPEGALPWQSGPSRLGDGQIICHNDVAPYNVVAQEGHLVGVIDWDLAGPGTALSDLAFVAWQWVPLHGPFVASLMGWGPGTDRAGRLRRLLDSYGLADRSGFIGAVADRVRLNRAVMLSKAQSGDPAYQALVDQGHVGGMDEALGYLEAEGPRLQAEL